MKAAKNRAGEDKEALILIVEDNDIDAMLLQRVVSRLWADVRIRRCEDGLVALDALESCRPDLIIMDIRMPRMDGLETLAELKKCERLRRIPVVMMSTSYDKNDISSCYDHHANAYVPKALDTREGNSVENLLRFWLDTVELSSEHGCHRRR